MRLLRMSELSENKLPLIAGIDDATKCPCIGSIFVAGVVADQSIIDHWKTLGVKDSKLIAYKKRNELASIIKKTARSYYIQEITPSMIDNKLFNLNEWEMLTVLKIISTLQRKDQLHEIIIDNWEVTESHFKMRFEELLHVSKKETLLTQNIRLNRKKLLSARYNAQHKADENYTIVGAASILAKAASDKQYKKFKKIYGNFGSGSPADPATRLFVWNHRNDPLPIIRTSWNTFKTISILERIEDDPIYARVLKNKQSTDDVSR